MLFGVFVFGSRFRKYITKPNMLKLWAKLCRDKQLLCICCHLVKETLTCSSTENWRLKKVEEGLLGLPFVNQMSYSTWISVAGDTHSHLSSSLHETSKAYLKKRTFEAGKQLLLKKQRREREASRLRTLSHCSTALTQGPWHVPIEQRFIKLRTENWINNLA